MQWRFGRLGPRRVDSTRLGAGGPRFCRQATHASWQALGPIAGRKSTLSGKRWRRLTGAELRQATTVDERLAANRSNWDERTALHLTSRFYDVETWVRDRRGPRAREIEVLGDVSGLHLLHLQCHFGLDTLARARAGTMTGLDFSPAAIEAAVS